ncbi:hypothetical protein TRFO_06003 [Tritrichomonas foetus]|uniref:Glycosyltransferase 61 catalytic domain-containing protein n=1 Tax=Tritrichomonas foetus TaxID=1144522 RepID=A0A1J4K1X9_9EUKA|nr:hypothetical protein TRFO_06003 [Tritrichomonas foetus]|eukprot:OHT05399.1 hypothetical protein TRFO_06003 [Tritrichomonas foetus]
MMKKTNSPRKRTNLAVIIISSVLISTFLLTFLQFCFFSENPFPGPIIQNGILSKLQLEGDTNIKTAYHDNSQSSFLPLGEGSVTLHRPQVFTTSAIKGIVSREEIDINIDIPEPHEVIRIGEHAMGGHLPFQRGSFSGIRQNIVLYHVENATFLSEAVFIQDGDYYLFTQACHPRYWPMFYKTPPSVTYNYKIYQSAICLGHQHSSDFGHWFLEVLPAYAIMPEEILKKSVVVVPFKREFVIFGFEFIGVKEEQIVEGDNIPIFAYHYYTMDYTFCGDLNKYLIAKMRQMFIERFNLAKEPPTEYVTFNRPNMSRCIGNYKHLRNELREKWPSIKFSDGIYYKSLKDQAVYFDKIKFLFAVHGSVLANIIFMQPNTVVVDLQMEQWLLSFLWLSAYTGKFMVVGRDPRISWRGIKPNIIDLKYAVSLIEAGLKAGGYIP